MRKIELQNGSKCPFCRKEDTFYLLYDSMDCDEGNIIAEAWACVSCGFEREYSFGNTFVCLPRVDEN